MKIFKIKTVVVTFLFVFSLVACTKSSDKIKRISSTELQSKVGQQIQLIDVRTPEEFLENSIEGAQNIDISSKDFEQKVAQLDKNKPIYVYCRKGSRSQKAAQKLEDLGFTEIYDLKGGILEWNKNINN